MSDDEGGGSTGLIIGMILGGAVVLVILGAGPFFVMGRLAAPIGPAPIQPPLPEIAVEDVPAVVVPEKDPEDVRKARERLVGVWLGADIGKRRPSLEFRADGTARWLWPSAAGPDSMEAGDDAWEVKEAEKDRLKVRFFANLNKQLVYEHQLRFDGDDRLIIVGPLKDARMIIGKDGNAAYQRKPAEKKP